MDNNFEEINLSEILAVLASRWWIVFFAMLLCLIIAGGYTFYLTEPVYQSDTSLYVGKKVDTQGAIAYNDLILADRLVNDYRELVKSRLVTGMVIKELDLEMTSGTLARMINVNSKKDTRLIEITAENTDPEMAMKTANKIAEVFKEKVVEIMDVENVKVIDQAILPTSPVRPNVRLNLAISLVLGFMLGVFIVFVAEYFDRSVKTPEDVKKAVGLPVIGMIPEFSEE